MNITFKNNYFLLNKLRGQKHPMSAHIRMNTKWWFWMNISLFWPIKSMRKVIFTFWVYTKSRDLPKHRNTHHESSSAQYTGHSKGTSFHEPCCVVHRSCALWCRMLCLFWARLWNNCTFCWRKVAWASKEEVRGCAVRSHNETTICKYKCCDWVERQVWLFLPDHRRARCKGLFVWGCLVSTWALQKRK